MKKIMNRAEDFVKDYVQGVVKAHSDQLALLQDDFRIVVRQKNPKKNKVGIVTAGGSGHLPLFLGYVGEGMLDGCAVGNVFASPSASKMEDMIRACDFGKGVLCLYGNYGGDNMNFEMATDMVEFDGIQTVQLRGKDDIASAEEEKKETRRGVAGIVYAYKIAGAAADCGEDLQEVVRVTQKALDHIRTMGVALSPCIVPEVGEPTFHINDDEMEVGMGIHGEQGIETTRVLTANEVADLILRKIMTEISLQDGDTVSVMINGLGATPLEEQYIVYQRIHDCLKEKNIRIVKPHIGEFATSMEMAGLSVTVFKLDEELERLLKATAKTPFYTNYNK